MLQFRKYNSYKTSCITKDFTENMVAKGIFETLQFFNSRHCKNIIFNNIKIVLIE